MLMPSPSLSTITLTPRPCIAQHTSTLDNDLRRRDVLCTRLHRSGHWDLSHVQGLQASRKVRWLADPGAVPVGTFIHTHSSFQVSSRQRDLS